LHSIKLYLSLLLIILIVSSIDISYLNYIVEEKKDNGDEDHSKEKKGEKNHNGDEDKVPFKLPTPVPFP